MDISANEFHYLLHDYLYCFLLDAKDSLVQKHKTNAAFSNL